MRFKFGREVYDGDIKWEDYIVRVFEVVGIDEMKEEFMKERKVWELVLIFRFMDK